MKLVSSIYFIVKFFLGAIILITIKYLSRNVHRGFICGDPALSLKRKPDTVTNLALVFWGTSPLLVLMICEIIFNYETLDKFQVCLRRSWKNTAYLSHRYFIDMIFMYIIMSAVKLFTGAHRPHFFESCQPDRLSDCVLGTFVSDYKCLRTSEIRFNLDDASMSFFSGHASTCVYSCLFIVWYLHKRVKSTSLFLVSFMQVSLICLAYFGSISRVFDHRHHWWDVLAGGLVGILTTYHACFVLCNNRCSKPDQLQLPTEINNTFLSADEKPSNVE